MNFFGLGPGEIAVIAVLALIVVGPQQLPSLLKQLGGLFSRAKDMQRDLQRGVDDIVREADLKEITSTVSKVRNFNPTTAATNFVTNEFAASDKAGDTDDQGFSVSTPTTATPAKATSADTEKTSPTPTPAPTPASHPGDADIATDTNTK